MENLIEFDLYDVKGIKCLDNIVIIDDDGELRLKCDKSANKHSLRTT